MSDFSALNTALSALMAQRRALDVTGQNIANVNTEGYTRQRVQLAALAGPVVPAIFARWQGAGQGVSVLGTQRLNDVFVEGRALVENGTNEQLTLSQTLLSRIEAAFGEPGDNGVASALSSFWSGWGDVANNPGDLAARSQLIERAKTLAGTFNHVDATLSSLWSSTREQLDSLVSDVNGTAKQVAELNQAILAASKSGLSPNELQDQRDLLVSHLAKTVGATARPGDGGVVDVFVGGTALVRGGDAHDIVATQAPGPGTTPTVSIVWSGDGYPVSVGSGQAAAMVQALNVDIPGYRTGLDHVVADLTAQVNTQHAAGFDLDGNAGAAFFTGTTAATVAVGVSDPRGVAASATPGGNIGADNALALADLGAGPSAPDAGYRTLIVQLGVAAQTATRRSSIQQAIVEQVDQMRASASGVSLDEEMANMVMYQHAYDGAARYLTAVDEVLDTLINHFGLVGR